MAKQLKKEGILLSKPTSYGEEVSINSAHRDKIMHYVKNHTLKCMACLVLEHVQDLFLLSRELK